MSDTSQTAQTCDLRGIREAVCVHTDKITDSCLAKDCIEDLRVYLTLDSQRALDGAASARARYVELMHVSVQVEPVPYNTGHYTVDITYYYRVLGETSATRSCPNTITGLAVFSKRLVLFGGESRAKTFLSRECGCLSKQTIVNCACPTGVVEVVDPIILGSSVQDACSCCCTPETPLIPEPILACFDQELVLKGECRRMLVTIGQFSITRLQRATQLLIPTFDYCVPTRQCPNSGAAGAESPCDVFGQIEFPMDAFFPSKNDSCIPPSQSCTGCARTADK